MCKCIKCANTLKRAVGLRTQNTRICIYCGAENSWLLDKGQAPIGYTIDEDFRASKKGEEE